MDMAWTAGLPAEVGLGFSVNSQAGGAPRQGSGMPNLKMHVLVVDDFATMRKIIRNILKQVGFEHIHEADDGTTALPILRDENIGLVVTDWNMPNMSGLELLQKIRGNIKTQNIPVIMVTAEGQKENIIAAVKAGVDNYIVKPFTAETLKEKLDAVFKKRRI
jgi:two-component system chemotaxis response regulator CheY